MHAVHDAFRRDAALLMSTVHDLDEPAGDLSGIKAGWATFSRYLAIHQMTEDIVLWPAVRSNPRTDPWHMRVLDAMESDHARMLPLTERVDRALSLADRHELRQSTEDFCVFLLTHLDREETEALPLVLATVTAQEWAVFEREQRRQLGPDWAAEFYPWLLDGAADSTQRETLRLLPVVRRLAYHTLWRPRYEQRQRWRTPVAA